MSSSGGGAIILHGHSSDIMRNGRTLTINNVSENLDLTLTEDQCVSMVNAFCPGEGSSYTIAWGFGT